MTRCARTTSLFGRGHCVNRKIVLVLESYGPNFTCYMVGFLCALARCETLSLSRMVQQDDSPSTLGAYGVRLRVQQRPPQYAARGRTVLAHRRGYSGRRLLSQVSPVALVFTTRRGDPRLPRRLPPWPARLCRSPISFRQAWVFGSPLLGLPFLSLPGLARTLRRVACEICRAAAAVRSPAPPALLTGDLVSDGPSGIFVYVSSYVSTAAFGWALDSLAGSRFFA